MRNFAFVIAGTFLLALGFGTRQPGNEPLVVAADTVTKKQRVNFEKQVLPLLVKNCSPCHFTGGRMYGRLPFDKDTTILQHSEKILPRFTKKEEYTVLSDFIRPFKKG